MDGLTDRDRERFIPDPQGFVASVRNDVNKGFKAYTDSVILQDAYNRAARKILLAESLAQAANLPPPPSNLPSLENFFSERIFSDEGIASAAAQVLVATDSNEKASRKLMIVLSDVGRVKFGYGLQERVRRCLRTLRGIQISDGGAVPDSKEKNKDYSADHDPQKAADEGARVWSVVLNPSAKDSLSGTAQLRLALAYGPALKDQRPLADFLWFGSDYPSVRLLTRPKNPISNEGDRPDGESSIIGAFGGRAAQ